MSQRDVVVVGGGPAGSTTAGFLARAGRDVLVLERERFPRFHIGESLLPDSVPVLERLGVMERLEGAGFQRKWGAKFVFRPVGKDVSVVFAEALGQLAPRAWHVRRAEFDHILLEHARLLGAEVREGTKVSRVVYEGTRAVGVEIVDPRGGLEVIRAKVVVDATGRDTLIGGQRGLRERDPQLRQASLFAHYHGPGPGVGRDGGDIIVVADGTSWFWLIPLDAETTSVGVVVPGEKLRARGEQGLAEYFDDLVARTPEVAGPLANATRSTEVHATADFSYRLTELGGDGWLAVGDAGAFLDPVFSSGVHLALFGGELAARTVDRALRASGRLDASATEGYSRQIQRGLRRFRRFVVGFYDPAFARIYTDQPPAEFLRRGIVAILAGKVFDRHLGIWLAEQAFAVAIGRARWKLSRRRARHRAAIKAAPRQMSSR